MAGRTAKEVLLDHYRPYWEEAKARGSRLGRMTLEEFAIDSARCEYNDVSQEHGDSSPQARKVKAGIWLLERKSKSA